jgi:hypothetical protein
MSSGIWLDTDLALGAPSGDVDDGMALAVLALAARTGARRSSASPRCRAIPMAAPPSPRFVHSLPRSAAPLRRFRKRTRQRPWSACRKFDASAAREAFFRIVEERSVSTR